jgi:predicted dehydrogenase
MINVAIVGSGRAARELHLPFFKATGECNVVALCDPQLDWTRELARKFDVPKVYPTLREALEKERIDAVSVCSIPQNHLNDVLTAFEFGCHVLLEKPMAMNMDEVNEMKRAQEAAGKLLTVVHNFKFSPGIQKALEIIKLGTIGNILRIHANWMRSPESDRMGSVPDHWSHKLKGSRWAETLPHPIYIMYQMVGEMSLKSVQAKMVEPKHAWLKSDEVSITLEHKRGYADIQLSANIAGGNEDIIITGSKGSLICNYGTARLLCTNIKPVIVLHDNVELFKRAIKQILRKLRPLHRKSQISGHKKVIKGFVDEIIKGVPPLTSWEEAYTTMDLVYKIGEVIEN